MSYHCLGYELKESVACITLNRPETGNIITQELARELRDACCRIKEDEAIRAVVITGAGTKAFCLGNELEQAPSFKRTVPLSITEAEDLVLRYSVSSAIASISCPVVAAINGNALGQGLELVLSCDIRIASKTVSFGFPNVIYGLLPMDGGTQRLPRLIGKGKSLEMLLTGDLIDAEEALRIGLVSKLMAPEELISEVDQLIRKIKEKAPIALKYIKEAVIKGLDLTLEQGLRLEADLYFLLHTTQDRTEGITAFRGKRTPRFQGK